MIKLCNCKSDYRDRQYGKNNRVHNPAKSRISNKITWTCTVCGTKKD